MPTQVTIQYSSGRGKNGKRWAYIRPDTRCANKSRRVSADKIDETIEKYFPIVNLYLIKNRIFGAKDERDALKEYWRVCEQSEIGKEVPVELFTTDCSR